MTQPEGTVPVSSGEGGIEETIRYLWSRRVTILMMLLAGAMIGGVAGWLLPKEYEASVLVSPVTDDMGSGQLGKIGSLISQVGGLASLAGIGAPDSSQREETMATLQSMSLIQEFISENDLLPALFPENWDSSKKDWAVTGNAVPTPWKGADRFRKRVARFVEDRKTGMWNVNIRWGDPKTAAAWANGLVRLANEHLRTRALTNSQRNLAYLNEAASKTTVVDVQKAIYSLMEAELRREMLARGTKDYALKVIDPAIIPEKQSEPRPMLLISTGFFLGLFGAIVVLLSYRTFKRILAVQ